MFESVGFLSVAGSISDITIGALFWSYAFIYLDSIFRDNL